MRVLTSVCAAAILSVGFHGGEAAAAIVCGEPYTIVPGDNLSHLARDIYEDREAWSRIFYANPEVFGDDPSLIFPGQVITAPCPDRPESEVRASIEARAQAAKAAQAEADAQAEETAASTPAPASAPAQPAMLTLLTADDYRPFTDRSLPEGGLATNVIQAAFARAGIRHEIVWINDWSAHLDPLLSKKFYDMGFPWLRPPCDELPDNMRCQNFYFSEPVFEMLAKFFIRRDSGFRFDQDSDVEGSTLCRPAGYFTFDLDQDGRNWLKDGKVTLIRPQKVAECFELLMAGKVDAVALNEFTGRQAVTQLGLDADVTTTERASTVEGLRLVVARDHPQAQDLLTQFNEALEDLRKAGLYNEIVADHLALFWRDNG